MTKRLFLSWSNKNITFRHKKKYIYIIRMRMHYIAVKDLQAFFFFQFIQFTNVCLKTICIDFLFFFCLNSSLRKRRRMSLIRCAYVLPKRLKIAVFATFYVRVKKYICLFLFFFFFNPLSTDHRFTVMPSHRLNGG